MCGGLQSNAAFPLGRRSADYRRLAVCAAAGRLPLHSVDGVAVKKIRRAAVGSEDDGRGLVASSFVRVRGRQPYAAKPPKAAKPPLVLGRLSLLFVCVGGSLQRLRRRRRRSRCSGAGFAAEGGEAAVSGAGEAAAYGGEAAIDIWYNVLRGVL